MGSKGTTGGEDLAKPLISRLDRAVSMGPCEEVCGEIKAALEELLSSGTRFLPSELLAPSDDSYARRLLHRDPEGRYSAVVMVWAPGQGTPLHDHDGKWCVEGVYCGTIRVTSFSLDEKTECGKYRFSRELETDAKRGEAGSLIPPHEYHTIANPFDELAATVHVYCGEMNHCHVFLPHDDGMHRRECRDLTYSS